MSKKIKGSIILGIMYGVVGQNINIYQGTKREGRCNQGELILQERWQLIMEKNRTNVIQEV